MGTEFEKQPTAPPSSPKSPTSNAPRPGSPSPGNQQQPGRPAPAPQGTQPKSNPARPALKEPSAEVGEGDSESCSASCDDTSHSHDSATPKKGATTVSKDPVNPRIESEEAARARANQQRR